MQIAAIPEYDSKRWVIRRPAGIHPENGLLFILILCFLLKLAFRLEKNSDQFIMQFETLTKKQLQFIRQLYKRTERYKHGLFVIEGARAVKQALLNDILIVDALVVTQRAFDLLEKDPEFFSLVDTRIREEKPESTREVSVNKQTLKECMSVYLVPSASFRLISDTKATQEILLVCRLPEPLSELDFLSGSGLLVASDRIQDPGNMGSIIRTAVWFGVKGLIVSPDNVDLFHPKLVRSNAGSTAVLPWVKSELPVFLESASQKGWHVLLLDSGDGSESYKNVMPSGKDIIVVGNEASGISNEIRDMRFPKIRIDSGLPVARVESLNVSAAAAIMLSRFT